MKNIAVVLAGGTGSRIGGPVPKQFLPLGDRAVIEYSVGLFNDHPLIDEVAVVVHPDWRGHFSDLAARNRWNKLTRILDGGAERHLSTLSALRAYEGVGEACILLHDAARPWLSADIVSRVVAALREHPAVAVAVPATDTLFRVCDGCIADIPPRSHYYCAQTPQAFRHDLLADAYAKALRDSHFSATDDCGVLLRYRPDIPIHIVPGAPSNVKITYPDDLDGTAHKTPSK